MAEVLCLKGVLSFKLQNDSSEYYYDRAPVTMRANLLTVTSISFLFQKGFHQQKVHGITSSCTRVEYVKLNGL